MRRVVAAAVLACVACAGSDRVETERGTAVDHGRALFADTRAGGVSNAFGCATCHQGEAPGDRIYSGGSLDGATSRVSFWGGKRLDLLESINDCRLSFMDALAPWTASDDDARAMFAYLASRGGSAQPIAFTVASRSGDVPPGDPVRGKAEYALACRTCHGEVHDGAGRLATFIPRLPDEVDASHVGLAPLDRRLAFLRKIREGTFRDASGSMPPFSRETLSDDDVGALLAYLNQY
jgi:thiosulfate dehydrogenase